MRPTSSGLHRTAPRWGAALTSLLGTLVLVVGLVLPSGTTAQAAAPSSTVGAACAPGTGVTAVVDFATSDADTGAKVQIGCALGEQPNMAAAFTAAGFDIGTASFVCEIDGVPAEPAGCSQWPGAYWSLYTSTDSGRFPGTAATSWTFAAVGPFTAGAVPVGAAVLWQIQPYVEDWTGPEDNRTPRIPLAELADLAAPASSSSPPVSSNSGAPSAPSSGDPSSSAPSSEPSVDPSEPSASSDQSAPSEPSSAGSENPTSQSPVITTPAPITPLPPVTPTTDAQALAAAHWLGQQLANAPNGLFGNAEFPDWGLTIDALLALSAAGVGGDLIAATAARIQNSGEDYIGAADETASNSARIAKTALALQVAGLDPAAFPTAGGTRDLIAELRGTLNADGSFGGSDFPFVHALAIYALDRTPEGVPASAVAWLRSTQCDTAGNQNFGAYGYETADPCSSVDGDGTALAIQALAAADVPATDPAIADAADYLLSIQGANGGVPSSFGGINTNNTGLAAQALHRIERAPEATARMTAFVSSLQVQCSTLSTTGKRFSADDLGAIAYMAEGGFDSPITTPDFDNRDQWIRATTQAIFAHHLPSFDRITAVGARPALPAAPQCAPPATSSAPATSAPSTSAPGTSTPATATPPSVPATEPTTTPVGATTSAPQLRAELTLSTDRIVAGGSLSIRVTGAAPNTRHRVELHSDPVVLGTLVTDPAGTGTLTVRIPAGTTAGQHEILLLTDEVVASAALTVTAAAATSGSATATPSTTLVGPTTTAVDDAGNPLPNTGVSDGLRTLLVAGGLLLLLGAALLLLARRRTRSGTGAHLS